MLASNYCSVLLCACCCGHCSTVEVAELASGDVFCVQVVEPDAAAATAAAASTDGSTDAATAAAAAATDASPPRQKPVTAMSDTGTSGESSDDDEVKAVFGPAAPPPTKKYVSRLLLTVLLLQRSVSWTLPIACSAVAAQTCLSSLRSAFDCRCTAARALSLVMHAASTDHCYNYCNYYCNRQRSDKSAAIVPLGPQRKLIDGVWRLAASYPTIAEYRSHRKKQRFVTFQPYAPLGALHMRDCPGSGVSVIDGVPSITLEILDSAPLRAVAEVSLDCVFVSSVEHPLPHTTCRACY
jgi:hypothetical protein